MHFALILRVVAILLLIVSSFLIFPVIVALFFHEMDMIWYFVEPMLFTAAFALVVMYFTRRQERSLSNRDGFLLVSLSWIVSSLVGALPFYLSGVIPSYTDSFFETMSGFTTTGASILTAIEDLPFSMLFWRSLTHWLGGMGIVVLTIAVLPLLRIGGVPLMKAESPGPTLDKLKPKITQTAKILWFIYLGLSAAETALLMLGRMSLFDALTHTFGTLATGGFSPKNASVGYYDSAYVDVVVTVFMILAGMNFVLFYRLLSGDIRRLLRNTELKAYLGIFIVAVLIIAIDLRIGTYDSFGRSVRFAAFQAASILTTTGFVTADYTMWPFFAQTVLFILTFIGGCAGSTGGGIKVIRIVTLYKFALKEMKYLSRPLGVFSIRVGGEVVNQDTVNTISGFFFLYLLMLLVTTFVVASGGYDILTSLSSALVTLGNIGPGFGRIGPVNNYAFYPDYIKWFLSFAMMVGRLEVYTILILFTRSIWRR